MRCPRRSESGAFFREGEDVWRADQTCSFCGSLNPDFLMAHLEVGVKELGPGLFKRVAPPAITLGPTDKNYKAYVEGLPSEDAGKRMCYSSANYEQPGHVAYRDLTPEDRVALERSRIQPEMGHWYRFEPGKPTRFAKFYFQHFDEGHRRRFLELLNAGMLPVAAGGFYVLPFFARRA
jgi:hypothetical protein